MAGAKQIQHVTQEVLTFIAFKMRLTKKPTATVAVKSSAVSSNLIENLQKIVWTEMYVALEDSKEFTLNHSARMEASPKLYTTYVIYACHIVKKCLSDPYEMFVRTMTLAILMAIYSIPMRALELLSWTLDIFTNFFETELESGFLERGGWKKFKKYVLHKNSLKMYSKVHQLEIQGKTLCDIIQILEIQATPMKECLCRAKESSEIENHGPTLSIWDKVEANGFSAGNQFFRQLLSLSATVDDRTQENISSPQGPSNMAAGPSSEKSNGESVRNFLNSGRVQVPLLKRGTTEKIAYSQAKKDLQDLQGHCLEIEQLLDFIFGDTPEGC